MVDVQSPELGFSNTKSCISIAVIINPWVMCQETCNYIDIPDTQLGKALNFANMERKFSHQKQGARTNWPWITGGWK